jgi:hypothetical protein
MMRRHLTGAAALSQCAQSRDAADAAKAELNGVMLHDLELKIGWGKAVAIPAAPMYTAASVFATPAAGGGALGSGGGGIKSGGAAVPPPGVDAAPPWSAPAHDRGSALEGVGAPPVLATPGLPPYACLRGRSQAHPGLAAQGHCMRPRHCACRPGLPC